MKKFLKVMAVVLALTMLLAMLAACADKGDGSDTSDTGNSSGQQNNNNNNNNNTNTEEEVTKIFNQEQFDSLIAQLSANPELSKGKSYKLMTDVNYMPDWDASPKQEYGKLKAPSALSTPFPGISEFYGTFDGNNLTITSVYRVDEEAAGGVVGGFIDKLNGGTVKNLTFNAAYVFDGGRNGATVGGFIGTVNGANASLDKVVVNSSVYAANDASVTVGGVVGKVEADGFTMNEVTFGGKAGVVAADLTVPSASTTVKLAQLIGDAGDKAVTLTKCAANGDLICADGTATQIYANGSAVTATDCTNTPCENPGVVEVSEYQIFTAEELYAIAAYNKDFEGVTIKLMNDIDLNADLAEDAIPREWTGLTNFKGTFDGNNKILRGVWRTSDGDAAVGFIDTLDGGTLKNLVILDSGLVYTSGTAASSIGVVGVVKAGTVESVYSEMTVLSSGAAEVKAGGIVGTTEGAAAVKNVVFGGSVAATAGATDQLIAVQSAETVVSDVLAIGVGEVATANRTRIYTAAVITVPEGYDWTFSAYISGIAPTSVANMLKSLVDVAPDISWYNPEQTTFEIENASQLLGLSLLSQNVYSEEDLDEDGELDLLEAGVTFEGKVIKLTADIDLNPNWDASTTIESNGMVILAPAAKIAWTPIPLFKGTLDGDGHSISGIYTSVDYFVPSEGPRYLGGFINVLEGATVQNLIVDNSLAHFTSSTAETGTARIRIGGLFARVLDSTLDTIYADIDCWNEFPYHYTMGGMICEVDTAQEDFYYEGSISNLVYAGTSGRICSDGTWTLAEGSSRIYTAGMIGQNHNASGGSAFCYVTMENLSFIGTAFRTQAASDGCSFDVLLAYTGSTNYSSGIAANNCTYYSFGAFDSSAPTVTGTRVTNVAMGDEATDVLNSQSSPTSGDTYSADEWTAVVFENGAGVTDPILLPKTVVDMLGIGTAA